MIPSVQNPPMSPAEIKIFRSEMSRRMKGEFTPEEKVRFRKNAIINRTVYTRIISNNGGKNPILGL